MTFPESSGHDGSSSSCPRSWSGAATGRCRGSRRTSTSPGTWRTVGSPICMRASSGSRMGRLLSSTCAPATARRSTDSRDPLVPNSPVQLVDGDHVHLGSWTTITLRSIGPHRAGTSQPAAGGARAQSPGAVAAQRVWLLCADVDDARCGHDSRREQRRGARRTTGRGSVPAPQRSRAQRVGRSLRGRLPYPR